MTPVYDDGIYGELLEIRQLDSLTHFRSHIY